MTLLQTLLPFQIMLLVMVVYTLAIVVASILKGDSDAKLFGLGLAAASTLVAYDVLAAVGIVPRVSLASSYMGQALFVLAIGLILVRRFRQVHLNLIHAKNALSEQVGALESRNSEIELLTKTPLTSEQQQLLQTAQLSGDSLLSVINDVLDFSKVEAGRLVLVPEQVNLRTLLEDSAAMLAENAHRKGCLLYTSRCV